MTSPEPRASDRDRESVVERLRDAVADGRLDLAEFEERMSHAYAAKTRTQLAPLLADLPVPGDTAGLAATSHTTHPARDRIHATMSSTQRTRDWAVPRRLDVRLNLASVTLDFTEAVLPDLVEIDVTVVLSSLEVVVPPGVRVESGSMHNLLSSVDDRARATGEGPLIKIGGRTLLGSVRIKHPNPLTQWWRGFTNGQTRRLPDHPR